jgi:Predicted glutamine amidotransferases
MGVKLKQLSRHLIAKGLSINGEYVEYFIHKSLPIIGIQWHPERKIKSRKFNKSLFNTFLKMK